MKPLIQRITPGAARTDGNAVDIGAERIVLALNVPCYRANAEFIAEAFTVAHETGMTPRQMAERIAELEAGVNGLLAETGWHHIGIDALENAKRLVGAPDNEKMHREPAMPEGLPPLPPGTRYAGQLKDHTGDVVGYTFDLEDSDGWDTAPASWEGMKGREKEESAQWHLAVPI